MNILVPVRYIGDVCLHVFNKSWPIRKRNTYCCSAHVRYAKLQIERPATKKAPKSEEKQGRATF